MTRGVVNGFAICLQGFRLAGGSPCMKSLKASTLNPMSPKTRSLKALVVCWHRDKAEGEL